MKRVNYATSLVVAGSTGTVDDEQFDEEALEAAMDFDPDELREFLAADQMDVPFDPAFKRRLRSKLWNMVRFRYGRSSGRPS